MKQRITPDQLVNLPLDSQQKLHHYWVHEQGRSFATDFMTVNHLPLPLLSIGELIEFMSFHDWRIDLDNASPCYVSVPKWKEIFCEFEVADALWESVKVGLQILTVLEQFPDETKEKAAELIYCIIQARKEGLQINKT